MFLHSATAFLLLLPFCCITIYLERLTFFFNYLLPPALMNFTPPHSPLSSPQPPVSNWHTISQRYPPIHFGGSELSVFFCNERPKMQKNFWKNNKLRSSEIFITTISFTIVLEFLKYSSGL